MDAPPILKYSLEILATLFSLYRINLFFFTSRQVWTLLALVTLVFLWLTNIPDFLILHPVRVSLSSRGLEFLALALIFHPEIQWLVKRQMKKNPQKKFLEKNGALDETVKASRILASTKTGALLAIQRNDELTPYIEKSVVIDAKARHELLLTIFTPPTYLHDGGVILSEDRIVSCSAIFPLTQNPELKKDLGTRHRAAIGLSEETDALCVVVSEESGSVSVADRGRFFYDVKLDELRPLLEKLMRFKKVRLPAME